MATTTKAAVVIRRMRAHAAAIIDLNEAVQATMLRYTHNGGAEFLAPFFVDDATGEPRADLDVTPAHIAALTTKLAQFKIWVDNNIATFVQAE